MAEQSVETPWPASSALKRHDSRPSGSAPYIEKKRPR